MFYQKFPNIACTFVSFTETFQRESQYLSVGTRPGCIELHVFSLIWELLLDPDNRNLLRLPQVFLFLEPVKDFTPPLLETQIIYDYNVC